MSERYVICMALTFIVKAGVSVKAATLDIGGEMVDAPESVIQTQRAFSTLKRSIKNGLNIWKNIEIEKV